MRTNRFTAFLLAGLLALAGPAFAAPSVVQTVSGGAPYNTESFIVPSHGTTAGEVLIVEASTRSTFEGAKGCPSGWPAGWSMLVNSNYGGLNGGNLCAYFKVADGTETDFELWKIDSIVGTAWAYHRITGASGAVEAVYTATGNPPSLNPAGWGTEDTLWIAFGVGKATAPPAGYSLLVSQASGGPYGISLSDAARANMVDAEDPGAFTPANFAVSATIAIRPSP